MLLDGDDGQGDEERQPADEQRAEDEADRAEGFLFTFEIVQLAFDHEQFVVRRHVAVVVRGVNVRQVEERVSLDGEEEPLSRQRSFVFLVRRDGRAGHRGVIIGVLVSLEEQ